MIILNTSHLLTQVSLERVNLILNLFYREKGNLSRECANCHRLLDESFFTKNIRNADGLHSYCKECNALKAKLYNQTKGKEKFTESRKRQIDSGYFRYGHGAFMNMQKSAAKRGIAFNLTETQLKEWWLNSEDKCFYCGCTPEKFIKYRDFIKYYGGTNLQILYIKGHVFNKSNYYKISTMTIDRVNSLIGYRVDNMVKACWICNSLKSNTYSEEDMKQIGPQVIKEIENEQEQKKQCK